MTRDWNLIRHLLLNIENLANDERLHPKDVDSYEKDIVGYHICLLIEAKLIDGHKHHYRSRTHCFARSLTWQGYEFLDSVRDESIWAHFKTTLAEKSIAPSFDAIKALAKHHLEEQLSSE